MMKNSDDDDDEDEEEEEEDGDYNDVGKEVLREVCSKLLTRKGIS
jgi:hypothetical protein